MKKRTILVVTSAWPRSEADYRDRFMYNLFRQLTNDYQIIILAPKECSTAEFETWGELKIYRHRQNFFSWPGIGYGSGIMPNIRKNKWLIFSIPLFFFFQIAAIKKLCKLYLVDIVHANWILPQGFSSAVYKHLINKKMRVITSVLGGDFWYFNNFTGKLLLKFILKGFDSLVTVSGPIKENIRKSKLFKGEISVITMGVDSQKFAPSERNIGTPGEKTILFVGTLIKEKGIDLLVNAMPSVIMEYPNVRLNIIGTGNLKDYLVQLVQRLGISEHITFHGNVSAEDLPAYFASSDLFVLPSLSEGWPIVVMEAMSSGCVPLVTDIPVFKEYENRNDLMFIAEKGNVKSLETIMIKALGSDLDKMKVNVRNYALANFDWSIIAEKYKVVYENQFKS